MHSISGYQQKTGKGAAIIFALAGCRAGSSEQISTEQHAIAHRFGNGCSKDMDENQEDYRRVEKFLHNPEDFQRFQDLQRECSWVDQKFTVVQFRGPFLYHTLLVQMQSLQEAGSLPGGPESKSMSIAWDITI